MSPVLRTLSLLAESRPRVVLAVGLLFATLGAGVGLMGTSAWLIATAALHPSIGALQVAVVGVRFFGIARGVFRYLERLVSHDVTFRLLAALRVRVYRSLIPLAPTRLVLHRTGDVFARLVGDVDALEHAFVRVIGPAAAALLVVVLVGVLLGTFDVMVAATAVAALMLAGVLAPWLAWTLGRSAGEALIARRADLNATLVDLAHGLADIVAFGADQRTVELVDRTGRDLEREQGRAARATALGGALVGLLTDLAVVAVLVLGTAGVRSGTLDGVSLAVVALITLSAFEAVSPLPGVAQGLASVRAAARRLFELETLPVPVPDPARPRAMPATTRLAVHNLRVSYPGAAHPALDGVDLDLTGPGLVAVVGPSGSGKSTLAHVLLRFIDPPPGTVTLEGIDIRDLDADEVRARIAYMAQQTYLLTGTIGDNLRIACPDASPAALDRAVRLAGFAETVERLGGYLAWVGEQGAQLSGGERQRLALARAILKPAPVLVLDEPTAGVDVETERVILNGIAWLARDRAVLLITHRVEGLAAAREVIVLHEGRVVERGSFDDLVAHGTWLRSMRDLERDAAAVALSDG